MQLQQFFGDLFQLLPAIKDHHIPGTPLYSFLKKVSRAETEELFSSTEALARPFGEFGQLILPYLSMGAVDSKNLFDIDELILFSFYLRNRSRYRKVADIGANIGLHSILLSKCGYKVRSFEPDPVHYRLLLQNLQLNDCPNVETFNCAVSSSSGEMQFVRVLGNTTGSHLAGSKPQPYGKLEQFAVRVKGIREIIEWADFIKLDAEGHENQIVLATAKEQWLKTDAMIEVENVANAQKLFDHFRTIGVGMFSQKTGWRKVKTPKDIPTNYREGMMFASCKNEIPW